MNEILPQTYKDNITGIYKYLYNRDYKTAEMFLLDTFDKILKISRDEEESIVEALIVTNIICNEFNESYLAWVNEIGGNKEKEIQELTMAAKIDNYLLAHCSDFDSLDNLFYELLNYLLNNCRPQYKDEIYQQISIYKKTWQEKN